MNKAKWRDFCGNLTIGLSFPARPDTWNEVVKQSDRRFIILSGGGRDYTFRWQYSVFPI